MQLSNGVKISSKGIVSCNSDGIPRVLVKNFSNLSNLLSLKKCGDIL